MLSDCTALISSSNMPFYYIVEYGVSVSISSAYRKVKRAPSDVDKKDTLDFECQT